MTEKKKRRRFYVVILILLLVGIVLDIQAGYASIPIFEIVKTFIGQGEPINQMLILDLRLPRVITSLLVGIGLACSGSILQGVSKNDMAEPGILGINAGAGLAIALYILYFQQGNPNFSFWMPILAFVGSSLTFLIEYRLAYKKGKLHPKRLLLMGVAISLAITSITTILMLKMPDSQYAFVQNWLAGNIWGASWNNIVWLSIGIGLLFFLAYYKQRVLNVLNLGQDLATGLGVQVEKEAKILLTVAILFSSLCCAVGGGLSFVGLVCPHLARKIVGPNYKHLLPAAFFMGATLLVYADILSRTAFLPYEMPIGIVASVIGAPYFLYLLIKE